MLNHFIKSCTILGTFLTLAGTQVSAQDKKPNIVFFITDDYGWQDTSEPMWTEQTELNKIFRTPNMERLADQGVKFTSAYTASSVCAASRISIKKKKRAVRGRGVVAAPAGAA